MTIRFEPEPAIGGDEAKVRQAAEEAGARIHRALHVRLECQPVPCNSLPRFELKTKRMIDQRPKEFRRVLDR
jgi:phenylacetate-coenzyme A ligase PaaK-like adenylate-forming protein